jgi:orotate phosphoribosyltransferase
VNTRAGGDLDDRADLLEILRKTSLVWGKFTLASGRESDHYFDCKLTTYGSPRGRELACRLMYQRLRVDRARVNALGGLTLGAAPLVVGVSHLAWQEDKWELPAFVVRKEPKRHGRQRLIEGPIEPGWKVAILDDVMTTGGSVRQAVQAVRDAGAEVARIIVLVDREEGGAEQLHGYSWERIYTFKDFVPE